MITQKMVEDFMKRRKERGETDYSPETLAFSFLLGLPPNECEGLYPETDWDTQVLNQYDFVVDCIYRIARKGGK